MGTAIKNKYNAVQSVLLCILITLISSAWGTEHYFICGPDEDGCYDGIYQYCACIPQDEEHVNETFCLSFEKMICSPMLNPSACDVNLTFKNQQECLATLYQSVPQPACAPTTKSFCEAHHSLLCNKNGNPHSCRPSFS